MLITKILLILAHFIQYFTLKKGHSVEDSKYSSHCGSYCRSRWPRGLRHGTTAARLLDLQFRIPPRSRMSVS